MRASLLCVALLAFPGLPTASATQEQTVVSIHPDWLQNPSPRIGADPSTLKFSSVPELTGDPDQPTCYTLRSYFMKRVHPDTDETHAVGYSKCQPASRYGLKRAIEKPPTDRQDGR